MPSFKHLDRVLPFVDSAFKSFYDALFNDIRLAIFFDNDAQVSQLIKKQKSLFKASLTMKEFELKESYIKSGEFHYDLRIPYIDFIKGTDILQEHFLLNTQKYETSVDLMDEIFEYFKLMKAYTAKGYLNKMIDEDTRDIESFFEQTTLDKNTYLPKELVLEKIQWLKELLHSINLGKEFNTDSNNTLFNEWLNEMKFVSLEKKSFFENLEQRILINTNNLFYFLKREDYLEILPLYSSLLSIYKLTLMMNNAVTIEYANKIIEDMKLDSLTELFRKDIFEEILKKEIALVNRNSNYKMSVAYIDLDNFKTINDNFGHLSGDKVIEKIGQIIRKNIRASDIGFRIGGDELAIIFKNADKRQAKKVCKKIKTDFCTYEFIFNEDITFNVSVSIGIQEYDISYNNDIQKFLSDVDSKLYKAKERGRNQIAI